jgi:hypothetical protein
LCELHTLGADHYFPGNDPEQVPRGADNVPLGYCDNDVYEAARALTGWTLRDAHWQFPALPEYDSGEFLYWDNWHDKAGKYFLGRYILANNPGGALADGRRVMDLLCQHPGTARHLCTKLIRRFITDEPPAALVESAAAIWRAQWQAPDQIAQVLRHILNAPEVLNLWGAKTKRPFEAFAQALRATSAEFSPTAFPAAWMPYNLLDALIQQTGHGPFRWPTPDGFPDVASKWQGVGTLAQTWKLMSWLPELRASGSGDTPFLLRILEETFAAFPTSTDRTATALVDFWLDRIIGFTVEASRRAQLIDFLRQNASADAPIDLVSDDLDAGVPQRRGRWNGNNLAQHYSIARLRSTVALMFALPEFHQR